MLNDFSWNMTGYIPKHQVNPHGDGIIPYVAERIFQLEPEPPAVDSLNEYILSALREKNLLYFSFFLHHYETQLNKRIKGFLSVDGGNLYDTDRFIDIKISCREQMLQKLMDYDPAKGAEYATYIYPFIWDSMLRFRMGEEKWSVSSLTFYVIVVWMPKYAMAFAGMSEAEALKTISYYSMGSLVCVFIFAALLKKMVRPIWANVFNSALATITAAIIYLYPSPLVCNAGAFVIGFSAAGGILQLGVSVMSEFFPKSKAKVTSIYMMMGGLANFVIPLITGYLSNIGLQYIIVLDFTFALLALITAIIVFIRYYRVFIIPENDVRFGERKFSTRLNTIKHRG